MRKRAELQRLIEAEVLEVLKEDYARGIPDFALQQISSDASESLKRHIQRYATMVSGDPVQHRKMMVEATRVLDELEVEMKELMEEKLLKFMRAT